MASIDHTTTPFQEKIPPVTTMSASTVIDGRAIQAQFANLTEERDRYYRETDEAKAALQTTESKISAQRSTQTILNQQIQARSDVLGRSDRDVQQLRTKLEQLRRQHTSEAAEMKEVTSKLDDIEGRIVESKTSYFTELDGLNDELDAAMNRYDEGRIVRHLTVGSIADGLLPRIQTMIESERMKKMTTTMTTADAGNGNGGGGNDDEENALMELEGIDAGAGGGTTTTDDRAQKLQDLSDQIAASLGKIRDATNRLGVATHLREQTKKEIGQLRSAMMQGRNRDGRVSGILASMDGLCRSVFELSCNSNFSSTILLHTFVRCYNLQYHASGLHRARPQRARVQVDRGGQPEPSRGRPCRHGGCWWWRYPHQPVEWHCEPGPVLQCRQPGGGYASCDGGGRRWSRRRWYGSHGGCQDHCRWWRRRWRYDDDAAVSW